MIIKPYYETENGKKFEDFEEALKAEINEVPESRNFEGFRIDVLSMNLETYLSSGVHKEEPKILYWHPQLNVGHYYAVVDLDFFYIRTVEAFNLLKSIKSWDINYKVYGEFYGEGWYDFRSFDEIYKIPLDDVIILRYLDTLMENKDNLKQYFLV